MEAPARPAATIMLLRDGPDGIEVFMVVRHHAIEFAAGALVFPGGRVEESDLELAAGGCPNPARLDTEALASRVAAIRETFEECGVLLARPLGSDGLIDAATLTRLEDQHRAALNAGSIGFDAVLGSEGLLPAPDLLVHFAHWITPSTQPKRYDTHFFLAEAPIEHLRYMTAVKPSNRSGSPRPEPWPTLRPAASNWYSPPPRTWKSWAARAACAKRCRPRAGPAW